MYLQHITNAIVSKKKKDPANKNHLNSASLHNILAVQRKQALSACLASILTQLINDK